MKLKWTGRKWWTVLFFLSLSRARAFDYEKERRRRKTLCKFAFIDEQMLTKDKCALKYIVRSSILMWSYLSSSSSSSKRVKRKELYNKICITHIEFWSIDSQWKWCKREKLIRSYSHPTLCESMSVRWVIVNSKIMISSNLNVSRRSSFNWGHLNVIHHHWPYQTRECLFSFMQYSQLFEEERMFCLLTFVWIWRNDKQNEGGENQ